MLASNNKALALNPLSGETMTTMTLSDAPASLTPVVVDGTLLVVTNDGKLTAWR